MYSQAPNEIPSGYSGSAFSREIEEIEPSEPPTPIEEAKRPSRLTSFLERFHIGRYLKSFELEDLLILGLVLLLFLEDGEGDLFPLLLLFLLFE